MWIGRFVSGGLREARKYRRKERISRRDCRDKIHLPSINTVIRWIYQDLLSSSNIDMLIALLHNKHRVQMEGPSCCFWRNLSNNLQTEIRRLHFQANSPLNGFMIERGRPRARNRRAESDVIHARPAYYSRRGYAKSIKISSRSLSRAITTCARKSRSLVEPVRSYKRAEFVSRRPALTNHRGGRRWTKADINNAPRIHDCCVVPPSPPLLPFSSLSLFLIAVRSTSFRPLFSLSRFLAHAASLRPFLAEFARVARFSMPSSTLMLLV